MATPGRKSVLTCAPGWRVDRTRIDSMHAVNLGVAHFVIGNAVWFLASNKSHVVLGPAIAAALPANSPHKEVWFDMFLRMKRWLHIKHLQCSCRGFSPITLHTDKPQPCFFRCKAAQAPRIIAWLSEITLEFAQKAPDHLKAEAALVSSCVWGLATYFQVLRGGSRFLSTPETVQLEEAGTVFLNSYSELARINVGTPFWHIVPKFHQFHHLVLDAVEDKCNPHFFTCFGDEDMVGQMLKVARAGHASTVVDCALSNYTMGMVTRVSRFKAEH
jgi:hypothetical protein